MIRKLLLYIKSINGRLFIKVLSVQIWIVLICIILFQIYVLLISNQGQEFLTSQEPQIQDVSNQITNVILTRVSEYFNTLNLLQSLCTQNYYQIYQPMTAQNMTYSTDQFSISYANQQNITGDIQLYKSIYKPFQGMTYQGWQTTIQITSVQDYILEFMRYYDYEKQFFTAFYIVDQNHSIIHKFPVITTDIDESYLKLTQSRYILYSTIDIKFVMPFKYGIIIGVGQIKFIQNFLNSLQSTYYINIRSSDESLIISNQIQQNEKCECYVDALMQVSSLCETPTIVGSFQYQADGCISLYFRKISTTLSLNTSIYLIVYKGEKEVLNLYPSFMAYSWFFYVSALIFFALQSIYTFKRVSIYTRDITNPIKQLSFKMDKIINNIFQIRVISKIQADDILIKEETEVTRAVNEFSRLIDTLKNANIFNITTYDGKQQKEIFPKQQDKTLDQIKQIVQKFKEQ
ncbi:hypothetical protein pb186bvf_014845 [Paramecium bursaria]